MIAKARLTEIAIGLVIVGLLFAIWWRGQTPPMDRPAVLARIQQLNELATVKYTVEKVVGIKDQKYPVGSESILLIVQANVEAGVDLADLHPDDVTLLPGRTVVLRLPEPRILNVFLDEKATRVWDREKTWWTPWVPYSLDLEHRARLAGLESARTSAIQMGILSQAERNAETSIRGLLTLAGVKSVRIVPWKAS